MNTFRQLLLAFLFPVVISCGACSTQIESGSAEKGVLAESLDSGYFTVRPDVRDCAAPACGGFMVKKANQGRTVCADGQAAEQCYVAELDTSALRLPPKAEIELRTHAAEFLLHGSIVRKGDAPDGNFGTLQLDEAWRGHRDTDPNAAYFRARNSGIVCITFPCPSFVAEKLNVPEPPLQIANVDLTKVGVDVADAQAQLNKREGLLVAGALIPVSGPGGSAQAILAGDFYLAFAAKQEIPSVCGSRGLAGCAIGEFCKFPPESNCGATDMPGVCAALPTICYKIYRPVCGCDGQTYSNDCEAAAKGVSVQNFGPCLVGESLP